LPVNFTAGLVQQLQRGEMQVVIWMIRLSTRNSATNKLTVMTQNQKEVSITVDAQTKVTKGDQPSSLSELKRGRQIKAEVQNLRASRATSISFSASLD